MTGTATTTGTTGTTDVAPRPARPARRCPTVGHRAARRSGLGVAGWLAAAALVAAAGCSGGGDDGGGDGGGDRSAPAEVALVGPDEFAERMTDPEAVVVNVHVPYEGEIAGTDGFIPFDEITSSDELPEDRDRPLLVYCRSGNMSADATADLVEAGYTDVTDLEGGMIAWEDGGRAIEHRES